MPYVAEQPSRDLFTAPESETERPSDVLIGDIVRDVEMRVQLAETSVTEQHLHMMLHRVIEDILQHRGFEVSDEGAAAIEAVHGFADLERNKLEALARAVVTSAVRQRPAA